MVSPVVGLAERMLTIFRHRIGLGYAVVRYIVGSRAYEASVGLFCSKMKFAFKSIQKAVNLVNSST